jgi:hypothetical protein
VWQKLAPIVLVVVVVVLERSFRTDLASISWTAVSLLSRRDLPMVATRLSSPKSRQFIAWYPCENGNRPVEYGMIGSDRRATIGTINQPGLRIRPCLRDGFSIERVPSNELPGYDHSVPTGRGTIPHNPAVRGMPSYPHLIPSGQKPP